MRSAREAGRGRALRAASGAASGVLPATPSATPPELPRMMIDDAVLRRLRYVKISPGVDLSRFPDFMIVGPQRTGTTWLHAHLRFHPQVMLSEPKELYFFSSLATRDPKRFVSDELAHYLRFFREPLWLQAAKIVHSVWKHGQVYHPIVRGEATASYAALEPEVIDDITALAPDLRVILMIRNPIERAWSHAKKDLVRNRGRRFEDVTDDEFHAFFTDPYQLRCGRSVAQYENWSARLRPGHLFVGAFTDIATRPEALMLDVMRFLGVRADPRYIDRAVRNPVNPTAAQRIPPQHRRRLEELYGAELARLRERFGMEW